jgi:hypothetical protein
MYVMMPFHEDQRQATVALLGFWETYDEKIVIVYICTQKNKYHEGHATVGFQILKKPRQKGGPPLYLAQLLL